jgi:hypothetical protein
MATTISSRRGILSPTDPPDQRITPVRMIAERIRLLREERKGAPEKRGNGARTRAITHRRGVARVCGISGVMLLGQVAKAGQFQGLNHEAHEAHQPCPTQPPRMGEWAMSEDHPSTGLVAVSPVRRFGDLVCEICGSAFYSYSHLRFSISSRSCPAVRNCLRMRLCLRPRIKWRTSGPALA